jgi:cytochrome c oxidase assembly protein Cox11
MLSDPDAKGIEQITLSYTFHPAIDQPVANDGGKALDRTQTGG